MLLEWAAGNLAQKMVYQNLESQSKNPLRPTKKKPCKENCCFQTMPRALDVLHSTASSALFAIFLRCLLLTPHGPISAGATSRGKSFPSSEAPIRPVEATDRSTFPGGTGQRNGDKQWRNGKTKLIWLIFFLEIFLELSSAFFCNALFQRLMWHAAMQPSWKYTHWAKRAAGDRRRWCIIMTWQAVAIKCSNVFKCVSVHQSLVFNPHLKLTNREMCCQDICIEQLNYIKSAWKNNTPWKFNIAPENKSSQKESNLQTIIFQGLC